MTNDIEQIRKRLEAATPGPWHALPPDDGTSYFPINGQDFKGRYGVENKSRAVFYASGFCTANDADFIAHAPADIRFLLAELEATQKQLADALKVTTKNTIEHVGKPK
jgi:hypothetical protein